MCELTHYASTLMRTRIPGSFLSSFGPANVYRISCGEAPRAGGSSGAPLAATNVFCRRARDASGVTPFV